MSVQLLPLGFGAIWPPCSVLMTDSYLDRASLATTSAQPRLFHQRETGIYFTLVMNYG